MRHARLLRRLSDAAGHFVDDYVVVSCVAAKQAAQADDGVVFFGFGQRARGRGNFEGAGDADNFNIPLLCIAAQEPVERALEKSLGDESVKAGNHDAKALTRSAKFAFNGLDLEAGAGVHWRS